MSAVRVHHAVSGVIDYEGVHAVAAVHHVSAAAVVKHVVAVQPVERVGAIGNQRAINAGMAGPENIGGIVAEHISRQDIT